MTPDIWLRTVLAFTVMLSCFGWASSIRLHWTAWADDPRARYVALAILPILMLNGIGIIRAATLDQPITWITWGFLATYLLLNVAMWARLPLRHR
jgi:hypothetical protein